VAANSVTQIAKISQLILGRRDLLSARTARAAKSCAQGQARGERPRDGLDFFGGKEEWTSHNTAILCAPAVDCVEFFSGPPARALFACWVISPMSDTDRLTMLSQFLEQNPGDAFARYGLAMEYSKAGQTEQALEQFGKLLELHPDYTNGYFMAAQTLERAGRTPEAKKMLENGIEAAKRTGNKHALSEMSGMLEELSA
jgi:hypothetical protein